MTKLNADEMAKMTLQEWVEFNAEDCPPLDQFDPEALAKIFASAGIDLIREINTYRLASGPGGPAGMASDSRKRATANVAAIVSLCMIVSRIVSGDIGKALAEQVIERRRIVAERSEVEAKLPPELKAILKQLGGDVIVMGGRAAAPEKAQPFNGKPKNVH